MSFTVCTYRGCKKYAEPWANLFTEYKLCIQHKTRLDALRKRIREGKRIQHQLDNFLRRARGLQP